MRHHRRSGQTFVVAALIALPLLLPAPAAADEALGDLVERVAPSVVNLHTSGVRAPRDQYDAIFGGGGRFESLGSGFVVDGDLGLVITNHHVVAAAQEILVSDHEGRVFEAKVVGSDAGIDLALVQVPGLDLPAVTLGSSAEVRVGDDVFAVGNPFGHGHTVTRGILSARSRFLGRDEFDLFMQTDAAINQGSSGGPLFDMSGRVVGVNTAIDGRGESLGFAMPSELVVGALPLLEKGRPVEPGWPGLRLQEIRGGGLQVVQVFTDGPADRGGLAVGDLIASVDGRPVLGRNAWLESFGLAFPGDERTLLVSRRGEDRVRKLKLEAREDWANRVAGQPVPIDGMYVTVRRLAPDLAQRLGIRSGGVQVVTARQGAFFAVGDVVLEIDGAAIGTTKDMVTASGAALKNRRMSALVYRGGGAVKITRRW